MPNFMPKAFTRRKSSGNALEEFDKPVESSFRVMPRAEVPKSATTGELGLGVRRAFNPRPVSSPMGPLQPAQPLQHLRQNSYDESPYTGPGNRGSNGSSAANSSASRFYDTGSSARHSSTSTLPSSAEFDNDDLFTKKVPVPSEARDRTSSFTSITGRFAFHRKSGKPSGSPTAKNDSEDVHSGRDRAMTASSYASTAHPPKLENLPSSDFGNDFGDLFSSFAAQQRKSAILEESPLPQPPPLAMRSESEPTLPPPPKTFASSRPTQPPSPIRVDRTKDVGGSPYSWDSRDSNDALMASPPVAAHSPYNERAPPVPRHSIVPLSASPPPLQVRTNSSPVSERKPARNGAMKTPSLPVEDADARMVRESFRASRDAKDLEAAQTRQNGSSESSVKTPSFSSAHSSIQSQHQAQPVTAASSPDSMAEATPRAKGAGTANEESRPLFSKTPPTPQTTRPGVRFESQKPARMTQAEFAVLQRQHQKDPLSDDESDVSDEYIDDDQEEEERKKIEEMRKIRQQQQEKMSAHREMMKKTVGGMNQSLGGRPVSMERPGMNRASMSTSELLGNRASYYGGNEDEDETDDIPLGILKEHKFPKLGNRLSHHSSLTNLRSASAQGMRPVSAAGSVVGGPGNLPPFARGLPADLPSEPYLGANLVQQPMRESIGYGAMGPASVYEGSTGGNAQPTLVNMIADAEQAKEARRGGATKIFGTTATYGQRLPQPGQMGMGQGQGMGMLGLGMGMPQAQPQQMFMPQQQQQLSMNMNMQQMQMQQMQAMAQLQQQMQMMLQQQQMGIQQGMPQMGMQPVMQQGMMGQNNFGSPLLGQRPMSMASAQGLGQQRTRSMVNPPSMSFGGLQQQFGSHLAPGYAPSLAPSERSNVGQSARYRPVTQQIHDGSSTVMSQSTVQPGQAGANRLTIRVKAKSPKSQTSGANEDDDDEGWGSPKKKWSAKKRSKSDNQLTDFIPAFE
ncbi:uncharacterized protein LTHEOB_11974 [Lasiodiplodia theobromae]|uniref:Pollen-specific leucine-rich repeat extensin-like protein 1 n=1 Tax=Lasiodiplodia theobromae TaxID=45133 RepID=A0A5N5D3X1_9PEZI|nr:uncharacterized protein LTHEOB_11974 [Lasiodiplodia theobromae]KAB2572257.1 Pollen-specific leucine-rich repeat extensin-like protein 1 [Lasiodiplodia theobromae]KAF4536686.1 hypothetical protein LTHEOB_11974 [Lasiodiplodia theobromae]